MLEWLRNLVTGTPHFQIPGYLDRWHLIPRNRFFNVYLHRFVGSDPGRDLHDHPWNSVSVMLAGKLEEDFRYGAQPAPCNRVVKAGQIQYRKAELLHRLSLPEPQKPAWTLFLTGPHLRTWGFETRNGWIPWYEYDEHGETAFIG